MFSNSVFAQNDTLPAPSVDPALMSIFNAKYPKKYIIADIAVKGNKAFDPAIVISVSGLAVGDEVTLPGGDNFAKAINKLWSQNMFTNINIWITKLEENNIWVEIDAVERPMLADYKFKGIRKTEADELKDKVGLVKSRVVTDNMKLSAKENIIKYYTEKGFRGAAVEIEEKPDTYSPDKVVLTFNIVKGLKVRISEVFFFGNQSAAIPSLKRKLKGTKEMTRITLFPDSAVSPYGPIKTFSAKEFIKNWGFLKPSQIRDFMDPWFRFKLFASAKFDEKKISGGQRKNTAVL